jgi:hypothetical protein
MLSTSIPVSGHCWSNICSATVLVVGAARIACSLVREKPRSSAPVRAKMKSIPKYDIISLFVMLAAVVRYPLMQ